MSIRVDGELDAVVPQLVTDIGEAFALLNQEGGVRMPQVVDADTPYAGFGQAGVTYRNARQWRRCRYVCRRICKRLGRIGKDDETRTHSSHA